MEKNKSEREQETQTSPQIIDDTQDESLNIIELSENSEALDVHKLVKTDKFELKEVKNRRPIITNGMQRDRSVLDQDLFDKTYGYRRVDLTLGRRVNWHFRHMIKWNSDEWLGFLAGIAPISRWLPKYKWREWFLTDFIGGLMCAIMSIPQGLAYGYMVGVPPNYGLITGIFGSIIYAILGTSRHTSPGSFAIVSLMVGSAVQKYTNAPLDYYNSTEEEIAQMQCLKCQVETSPEDAIRIATTMTLLVGLFQIIFAILNMGLLAVWLSDQLVQGLTCGAAIHVLTSQLKTMTGIKTLPSTNDPFSLVKFYLCLGFQIKETNITTLTVAVISITLLLFSCYFGDQILSKWTKIKIPMELFVVVGSILIVWLSQDTNYHINVETVGHVESGLVTPAMPQHPRWLDMIGDAITIAVISFVIHLSMAKMIAKKLNYEVNANQEWFALGFTHFFSSFFGCFAGGSSLGRSMTQVKFGTKTQLSTLICFSILVGFVYAASSLIYHLPKAVLAAIVVVAMKDLYIQLFRSLKIFNESYVDFLIYFVTLLSVIFISLTFGLIIGVSFALLSVVFRTQWAESTCMGRLPGTAYFKGLGHYRSAQELPGIKVFRFDAPLYFANAETFITRMYSACGVNPIQVRASWEEKEEEEKKRIKKKKKDATTEEVESMIKEEPMEIRMKSAHGVMEEGLEDQRTILTHIIIDCSSILYVDLMGKDALAQCYRDYASIDITVLFSDCKVAVRQTFEITDFYNFVPKNRMFVSLEDAVTQAQREQKNQMTMPKKNEAREQKKNKNEKEVQSTPVAYSPAQKTMHRWSRRTAQITKLKSQMTRARTRLSD